MHELSLVRELVETLAKRARTSGAMRITNVQMEMNPLSGFDADDVEFSFDLVKKEDPMMSEAKLTLNVWDSLARCGDCGEEFVVEELPALCRKCGSINLAPVHPTGLILKGYETE
jgi:hydrogenase nickel incorporation protein HypA/HybF